jgi:hypothetical protein
MRNGKQPVFNYSVGLSNHELESMVGLTKREYFAGLAMQGLCAYNGTMHEHNIESTVKRSIEIADELLKQLEQ